MEVRNRRKDRTSERVRARSRPPADHQLSSVLRRVVTWIKQTALFSWLHHAFESLKNIISGDQPWPVALVRIGLWLLLLWILSNLHMGLPCFLLTLVYWIYRGFGGGPSLSTPITWRQRGN